MRKAYWQIIFVFCAIFALASLLIYSLSFQNFYHAFIDGATALVHERNITGSVTFIDIETLAVMLSPFSSVPFAIIAISLWGKGVTLLYSMIGGMVGAILSYLIGYYALYPLLSRLVETKEIERYRAIVGKRSSFLLVLLFRLAMPVEIPGYVLGIAKYSFWKYLVATAIAYVPFYVLTIYAGEAFIRQNLLVLASFMALFVILFCIAVYLFYQKIEKTRML